MATEVIGVCMCVCVVRMDCNTAYERFIL